MIGRDEQRSYYRMMINADCSILIDTLEAPQEINAICRDLSSNGMALEIDQALDIGQNISFVVHSASEQIPSLTGKGKVLRCHPEGSSGFLCGVEIIELI
ncbi:PilZ domain-containing protein [Catenovulum sp. 2E275]|uniref:PilZ domain-containing protein n=1 Tax=Catenovulum sp. 2E275 TaxID=2980497 RepID=UPI0021D02A19|nr:PilZ domain-containing protein [Catenovulum sp. 2E275]MCU4674663.1 PilZ domain-containing protein [Catenovulum sp. 2E275]